MKGEAKSAFPVFSNCSTNEISVNTGLNIVAINASQVLIVVSVPMVDFQELFRAGGHQPSTLRPIIQPG